MSDWGRLGEWIATWLVASLAWASGLVSTDLPPTVDPAAGGRTLADQGNLIFGWAQQVDEPPIEQVGEGPGADVETRDEGAAPAQSEPADPVEDAETLDVESLPAADQDDVELLDQGSPPAIAAAPETTAPPVEAAYAAPAADASTAYSAEPVVASGPVLPEGFGTGSVHVAAGRSGFPTGLENCHVGAVTGRAYVGIGCGDDENSFVGHAPSFEDFPFVLDENFPFGEGSVFTTSANTDDSGDTVEVFVSPGRGDSGSIDDSPVVPEIRTSGAASVELAQRARDREPRIHVDDRGSRRAEGSRNGGSDNVSAAGAEKKGDQPKEEAQPAGKDDRGKAKGKENKPETSKNEKDHRGGKGKRDRASAGR